MARGKPILSEERETISRGIARDMSHRCIAAELGRHPSVISRETARNGGNANYSAVTAQHRAEEQVEHPKARKLETRPELSLAVNEGFDKK
ncbi:Helix-turn-helix domain-containing protein [Actinopolyspora xinjiangensis]|uniref:Helix-turn-helix domain-containing protein n=1 Tax=Actinopolyspora xinjiangensis TaxID=405564 RepID=A0A1H0RZ13_9ACTN|nr:helix-turn-helix domain-containing protein [Actinopolyspora xinjiangensis]SDP34811.1 Helix-turn-helix domain-containing protein [Actinopolyspora xinjiangensis]